MKLGISGLAGSFSEAAAEKYLQKNNLHAELVYLIDMEGVLSALENNTIDLGIFPVVNSIGGLVKPAFEAMGKHMFVMIDELPLQVNQCLMVAPNVCRENIKKIVSHPQALSQCRKYLKNNFPDALQVEAIDTAQAAQALAQNVLSSDTAVIAPEKAAKIYNLNIIEKNIEDLSPNITLFIITKNVGTNHAKT